MSINNNYADKVTKYRSKYFNLIQQMGGKTLNHIYLEKDVNEITKNIPFDVILIGSGALSFYLKDLYCSTKDEKFLDELDKLQVNDLDFIYNVPNKVLPGELADFTTNNIYGKNINYKRKIPANGHINEFDLSFVNDVNDFIEVDGVKLLNLDILLEFYNKSSSCKSSNDEKIRILNIILEKIREKDEWKRKYNID